MQENNATETSNIPKFVESSFHCETFSCELIDTLVTFQILKMENSLYIWIGQTLNPVLSDLSLALPSAYDSVPVATNLLGSSESTNMAKRLSKKLAAPVFISYNLVAEDRMILPVVEKKLIEELKRKRILLSDGILVIGMAYCPKGPGINPCIRQKFLHPKDFFLDLAVWV